MKARTLSPSATTVTYIWLGCWPTYTSQPTADKHVNSLSHLFRIRGFKEWFITVKPGPCKCPVARSWGSLNVDAIKGIPFSFQGYFPPWPDNGLISKWNKEYFVYLTALTSHYPVTGLPRLRDTWGQWFPCVGGVLCMAGPSAASLASMH